MARLNEAGHIVVGTPDGQTGCCHIEVFGKEKEGKAGRKRRKEGRKARGEVLLQVGNVG